MAANTNPIYSLTPTVKGVACGGTANTDGSGVSTIGTTSFIAFTAGLQGSFVDKIRLQPVATTAATATTATTIRVFVTSVASGATTQANTWLVGEVSAASQTADHSTNATAFIDVPLGFAIPASYQILVMNHVINAASTSWTATCFGGDY